MSKRGEIGVSTGAMVTLALALVGLILGIIFTINMDRQSRRAVDLMSDEMLRQNINMMLQSSSVAIPITYAKVKRGEYARLEIGLKNNLNRDTGFYMGFEAMDCDECIHWVKSGDANHASHVKAGEMMHYLILIDVPEEAEPGMYHYNIKFCHDDHYMHTDPGCSTGYDDFYMDEKTKEIIIEVI